MVTLAQLRYFSAVHETSSMSRAAQQLGISQPSLSNAIKELEENLGVSLFIRQARGLVHTPAGIELEHYSKQIQSVLQQMQQAVIDKSKEISGCYKFGCPSVIGVRLLPPIITEIQKHYPEVQLKMNFGSSQEIQQKIQDNELDIAIVVNPIPHDNNIIATLFKDETGCLGHGNIIDKGTKKDCFYHPEIYQSQYIIKKMTKRQKEAMNFVPCDDLEVIKCLVESQCGFGILPTSMMAQNKNIDFLGNSPRYSDMICLVMRGEKRQLLALTKLWKLIQEAVSVLN